jgi:hypothetical protein
MIENCLPWVKYAIKCPSPLINGVMKMGREFETSTDDVKVINDNMRLVAQLKIEISDISERLNHLIDSNDKNLAYYKWLVHELDLIHKKIIDWESTHHSSDKSIHISSPNDFDVLLVQKFEFSSNPPPFYFSDGIEVSQIKTSYSSNTVHSMGIGLLHGLRVGLVPSLAVGIGVSVLLEIVLLEFVLSVITVGSLLPLILCAPGALFLTGFLVWGMIEGYQASKELQKAVITDLSPSSLKSFEHTQLSSRFTLFQTASNPIDGYMLESCISFKL